MQQIPNEQLLEARQKFFVVQNRVNLLLVKDYKLRKQRKQYTEQLDEIKALIAMMESGQNPSGRPNRAVVAEDHFLREQIRNNSIRIHELERRIETQEIIERMEKANVIHENFRKMLNGDMEKKTRQALSSLKGKVQELRKKSKQLMKEIQTLEEDQKKYIDEYSLNHETLKEQQDEVKRLKDQIRLKKEVRG